LKIGMPEEAQMVIPASMNPMFDENRLNEIKEQIGEKAYKIDYSLES
jgi:anti-sigma28 factor (negative regulator of flagellin synthesis)